LAETISRIHFGQSISALFEPKRTGQKISEGEEAIEMQKKQLSGKSS
jgi:hypothetical protein